MLKATEVPTPRHLLAVRMLIFSEMYKSVRVLQDWTVPHTRFAGRACLS